MLEYLLVHPILVNLNRKDLVLGYDRLRENEVELRRKWRQPLLSTYSHQRSKYEADLKNYQIRLKRRKITIIVLTASFLIAILLGIGLMTIALTVEITAEWLSTLICSSPILCFSGLGSAIALGGIYFYLPSPKPPTAPQNPLKQTPSEIFPDLLLSWKEGLRGKLLKTSPDDGYVGEKLFIQELEKLDMQGYILHRLVQKVGDDLDLVIIGNKGLWLFEVKYWSGTIIHEQGQWHQEKRYFLRGGVGQTNLRPVSQPPEIQWKRMRDELMYTLTRHAPNLINDHPAIKDVQGGVVFTHPSAEIEIPKGAGFNWGNIPFWIQCLQDAPVKDEFCDDRLCLMITETIIKRHNIIEKDSTLQSMSDYVDLIVAKEEIKIKNWTQNQ
jgi:hypothetical protein